MVNCHYTPDQISAMTIPQLLCMASKKPPSERKLEAADYKAVMEEDSRKEKEWMGNE